MATNDRPLDPFELGRAYKGVHCVLEKSRMPANSS
jgi:hypothetical protein